MSHRSEGFDVASLYAAHADAVAGWAGSLGGPGIEPADVVQEVFVIVHRRLGSFRGTGSVAAWLYAITRNVVRNRRRKERWRRFLGGNVDELADQLEAAGPTPVEELERRRAAAEVYRTLERMREKYREVLVLFEMEGLSGEEISRLLGIKVATVWVRLHRARRRFLQLMEKQT